MHFDLDPASCLKKKAFCEVCVMDPIRYVYGILQTGADLTVHVQEQCEPA